jgi:hypothetical protein
MAFEIAQAFAAGSKDSRNAKRNLLMEHYKGSDKLPTEAGRSAIKFWIFQRGGLVMDYAVTQVYEVERLVIVCSISDRWHLRLSDDWTTVLSSDNEPFGNPVPTAVGY